MTATAKYLQIVEANHREDAFHTLGGAGFDTPEGALASFRAAPTAPEQEPGDMNPGYVLDVLDDDLNVIDDKRISAATARALLGADLDTLREKAKADEAIVQDRIAKDTAERRASRA